MKDGAGNKQGRYSGRQIKRETARKTDNRRQIKRETTRNKILSGKLKQEMDRSR